MSTYTTRQGCSFSANLFLERSLDIRVSLSEKLTLINAAAVCTGTEVALGSDEVLPEEERADKHAELMGIVGQINVINDAHSEFTPAELYNGIDMLSYVADAILEGEASFEITF